MTDVNYKPVDAKLGEWEGITFNLGGEGIFFCRAGGDRIDGQIVKIENKWWFFAAGACFNKDGKLRMPAFNHMDLRSIADKLYELNEVTK